MDIVKFLTQSGVEFEVTVHEQAFTAQEVAATEHVSGHVFAKTVIVRAHDAYYMLVLPASRHVDLSKVAELVGAEAALATEPEMKDLFQDCEIGAEPPFGSHYDVKTFLDRSFSDVDQIVFRAGRHNRTVKMGRADYERIEEPTVADFAIREA